MEVIVCAYIRVIGIGILKMTTTTNIYSLHAILILIFDGEDEDSDDNFFYYDTIDFCIFLTLVTITTMSRD